jgi:hypothetical protein
MLDLCSMGSPAFDYCFFLTIATHSLAMVLAMAHLEESEAEIFH